VPRPDKLSRGCLHHPTSSFLHPVLVCSILHQYPTFERTGWQASGAYDPLAPALEKQLRQLFEPQHALLLHWLRHLAASSTEP